MRSLCFGLLARSFPENGAGLEFCFLLLSSVLHELARSRREGQGFGIWDLGLGSALGLPHSLESRVGFGIWDLGKMDPKSQIPNPQTLAARFLCSMSIPHRAPSDF